MTIPPPSSPALTHGLYKRLEVTDCRRVMDPSASENGYSNRSVVRTRNVLPSCCRFVYHVRQNDPMGPTPTHEVGAGSRRSWAKVREKCIEFGEPGQFPSEVLSVLDVPAYLSQQGNVAGARERAAGPDSIKRDTSTGKPWASLVCRPSQTSRKNHAAKPAWTRTDSPSRTPPSGFIPVKAMFGNYSI